MKKPKDGDKWVIEANKLTIYDVKKGIHGKGDNAVYQCKAENKHGYVWTNFYLNLLAFKPQLLTDAGEVEAVVGQSVTLECKFFASPNAVITWSSPLLQGIAHNVIPANPHGVGKLVIPNVTPDAEGEYECTGTNKYGQSKGAAKLLVRKCYFLEATRLEPFSRPEEVRIAGETIRLPCDATPDERLEVTYEWLVNGQPLSDVHLQSGHYKVEDDHSLLVHNPTQYDSAKYKCVASTKLDKVEKEVQIQIKDVPVPVHAAYVSKCDADSQSAEISFEHMEPADTVSPVKEFWVQYQMDSETEGTQWRTHPVPVQAHPNDRIEGDQRMVSGKATVALQPFGHVSIFSILEFEEGSMEIFMKDVCITPPKQPDRNPAGVWAKGASPENIVVHWRPMAREEWNGKNFHYKIKYRPSDEGGGGDWKEVQVNDPFADRYTITLDDDKDAKPFQPYEVQVQAVNDEGQANVVPETVQGRTGEGIPSSIPTGFRVVSKDGTTATFAWDPVDPKTANGNFTGYKITYWHDEVEGEEEEETNEVEARYRLRRSLRSLSKRNVESKRKTIVFGPKATSGTVTDLKPDTQNYATIQVTNGAHEGEPSEVITFRTAEGVRYLVPSPVRGLRAYPMNPRNSEEKAVVHLVWRRPRRPNGKLLKFVVTREPRRPPPLSKALSPGFPSYECELSEV
ncbi:fibronectin type III domain protein [Oesophagostomum dentatum]|uniref:Fibronectin type III domain protein n=1 Tax=Oesophagostomum dentatum TaxID=61180 RepID=A0A0B1TDY1_OESDE|nr:fibronectin type III domain protein [Oesophagostomum dentatum]